MADSSAPPTDQVANLHLDEVTGERISKSELKKRQKLREKEAKKQEKAAAAPPKPAAAKKTNAEDDEKELDPRQYFEIRSRAIEKLIESKDPYPYPHKFHSTYDVRNFVSDYGHLKSGDVLKDKEIRIAARMYKKRMSGTKLVFYDVRDEGIKLQIMCQAQEVKEGAPDFIKQHEHLRRGDIIGIIGYPGRTAPKNKIDKGEEGELSIFATEVILLSPCLHQLPDE
jgi:lysyl-tRNA synthetase class 2